MFHSARLTLTAWYLILIMLISVSFSMVIYRVLTAEVNRILHMEKLREAGSIHIFKKRMQIPEVLREQLHNGIVIAESNDSEVLTEFKERLVIALVTVNGGILLLSGMAGYFLAGRTLKPIQDMVDEQNRFITDASHELRTPLTALRSEMEVSLRDGNMSLKESRQVMESNLEEVIRLQHLSDNLIKLVQFNKGRNGVHFEKLSVGAISEEVMKKITPVAKRKHISLKKIVQDTQIEAEKQSFKEILVIFLDNAIKYSDENAVVTLSSSEKDNYVIIKISDTGVGIEKKDIPHIFDRFYRADKSRTKTETTGYGLGLAIAKDIIEKHHGDVRVKSTVGKGTTFTIKLPKHQPHQTA